MSWRWVESTTPVRVLVVCGWSHSDLFLDGGLIDLGGEAITTDPRGRMSGIKLGGGVTRGNGEIYGIEIRQERTIHGSTVSKDLRYTRRALSARSPVTMEAAQYKETIIQNPPTIGCDCKYQSAFHEVKFSWRSAIPSLQRCTKLYPRPRLRVRLALAAVDQRVSVRLSHRFRSVAGCSW